MASKKLEISRDLSAEIKLPRIPRLVQYYDAHASMFRPIAEPSVKDVWCLHCNGNERSIDFRELPKGVRSLLRHVLTHAVMNYAPGTTIGIFKTFVWVCDELGPEIFFVLLELDPMDLKEFWLSSILPEFIEGRRRADALKIYLKFLCLNNLGKLNPGSVKFISGLPGPKADLYAAVRSKEVFLHEMEQAAIVRHLDDLADAARMDQLSDKQLRDGCMLIASFQYAMRPVQIFMVQRRDVVIRKDSVGAETSVHVTFSEEKKRSSEDRVSTTKKIKREWSSLYTRYCARVDDAGWTADPLFKLSSTEVSSAMKAILLKILPRSRSGNDLRHTAAQRLVDHGASAEDLARFLGHKGTRPGLIYFAGSTNQAKRLNKALAASKIYAEIAIIGRDKVISPARLRAMNPENQVGGAPHGVPIAGIGACEIGQSLCERNPVISCYSCRKFMPVRSGKMHREVLAVLRQVVKRFADHNSVSPAFAQLTYSITLIERLLADEGN